MVEFRFRITDYRARVECLFAPTVTSYIPSASVDISTLSFPVGVCLADQEFHEPAEIDMLRPHATRIHQV